MTPGQFDMLKNADVPWSDVPPTNQTCTDWNLSLIG